MWQNRLGPNCPTFRDTDRSWLRELWLVIVNINDFNDNFCVASFRRGPLVRGGNGQLISVPVWVFDVVHTILTFFSREATL